MAYTAPQHGTQRTTTITLVVLFHLLVGSVLVKQFAPPELIPNPIGKVEAFFYSEPTKPPPPAPEPSAEAKSKSTDTVTYVPPEVLTLPPNDPVQITTMIDPGRDVLAVDALLPPIIDVVPKPVFTPEPARPANAIAGWATTNDYPWMSLKLDEHGISTFRVTVGSDGRVKACEIVKSSGHPRLDAATCKLVGQRARFEAATDATGEKVVGTYVNSISWLLPRR